MLINCNENSLTLKDISSRYDGKNDRLSRLYIKYSDTVVYYLFGKEHTKHIRRSYKGIKDYSYRIRKFPASNFYHNERYILGRLTVRKTSRRKERILWDLISR